MSIFSPPSSGGLYGRMGPTGTLRSNPGSSLIGGASMESIMGRSMGQMTSGPYAAITPGGMLAVPPGYPGRGAITDSYPGSMGTGSIIGPQRPMDEKEPRSDSHVRHTISCLSHRLKGVILIPTPEQAQLVFNLNVASKETGDSLPTSERFKYDEFRRSIERNWPYAGLAKLLTLNGQQISRMADSRYVKHKMMTIEAINCLLLQQEYDQYLQVKGDAGKLAAWKKASLTDRTPSAAAAAYTFFGVVENSDVQADASSLIAPTTRVKEGQDATQLDVIMLGRVEAMDYTDGHGTARGAMAYFVWQRRKYSRTTQGHKDHVEFKFRTRQNASYGGNGDCYHMNIAGLMDNEEDDAIYPVQLSVVHLSGPIDAAAWQRHETYDGKIAYDGCVQPFGSVFFPQHLRPGVVPPSFFRPSPTPYNPADDEHRPLDIPTRVPDSGLAKTRIYYQLIPHAPLF